MSRFPRGNDWSHFIEVIDLKGHAQQHDIIDPIGRGDREEVDGFVFEVRVRKQRHFARLRVDLKIRPISKLFKSKRDLSGIGIHVICSNDVNDPPRARILVDGDGGW